MYMAGLFLTASSPSRTWILSAPYPFRTGASITSSISVLIFSGEIHLIIIKIGNRANIRKRRGSGPFNAVVMDDFYNLISTFNRAVKNAALSIQRILKSTLYPDYQAVFQIHNCIELFSIKY